MNFLKNIVLTVLALLIVLSSSLKIIGCSPPVNEPEATSKEAMPTDEQLEKTTKENETEEATKDKSKDSPEDIIKAYYKYVDEGEFEKAYELLDPSYIPSRESLDVFVKGMQRAWAGAKVVSIQPIAEWLKQKDLPQPSHTIETEDKKWFAVEVDMKWKKDWIPVVSEGVNLVFIEVVKKGNIWKISMMGSSY